MPKRHLLSEDPESLKAWFAEAGEPGYRAGQTLEWLYRRGATTFEQMTNLPARLRERLAAEFGLFTSEIVRRAESSDGTLKVLLRWPDGATSECVMIPDGPRHTGCIGSQVGCPVGCRFCASGIDGVERHLTRGEIVEQVMRLQQEMTPSRRDGADGGERRPLAEASPRLGNVVFMGSGEPLANYQEVIAAIRTLNAEWGPHIGARKITVSTVGLPKQIRALADEGLQLNLALSLHAPTDALRRELIPWAERLSMTELLAACRYYFEKTGREITLEYILLADVNDRPAHAEQLARVAGQLRCNVNLIRYNPVDPLPYGRPTAEAAARFQAILRERGVNAHTRKSRGRDIDAACGQLRRRAAAEGNPTRLTIAGEPAGDPATDE